MNILHSNARRERAEQQSGKNVTQNERLPEPPGEHAADEGRSKDQGHIAKNETVHHRKTSKKAESNGEFSIGLSNGG
jgi:hypothetical protein